MPQEILIYEDKCKKCRFLSNLVALLDIRKRIRRIPIRSKEAAKILSQFYEHPPYNFHFIDATETYCFTGIKAIPMLIKSVLLSLFWPFTPKEKRNK